MWTTLIGVYQLVFATAESLISFVAPVRHRVTQIKKASMSSSSAVEYSQYQGEKQLAELVKLIDKDLSEPYSIFTYRYFLYNWPDLSILARVNHKLVGVIICRQEQIGVSEALTPGAADANGVDADPAVEAPVRWRGYIAMLAVEKKYRKQGIGSQLAQRAIDLMIAKGCEEVMLETEIANKGAIRLYENMGFVRDERLVKYYLNGGDAFRLKLWLK